MLIGYARVSTQDQYPDLEIDALTKAGCKRIFQEKMERELTVEPTRAGPETARKLGRKRDRKRRTTDSKIESARELLANGTPPRGVALNLNVSIPTLYRWIPTRASA